MEEIYYKYAQIVYNYLLSLTNNPDLAEDLMQETFYSAIKKINSFQGNCSMKTWLCQIAKNKWIDFIRKHKQIIFVSIDELADDIASTFFFENDVIVKEEVAILYSKIYELDENAKKVIFLRIKSELSFKEIANIMGKSEEWARTIFHRGKLKLKEDYENEKKCKF